MPIIKLGGSRTTVADNAEKQESQAMEEDLSHRKFRKGGNPSLRHAAIGAVATNRMGTFIHNDGLTFRQRFKRNLKADTLTSTEESALQRTAGNEKNKSRIDRIKATDSKLRILRRPTAASSPGELHHSSSVLGLANWASLPPHIAEVLRDLEIADGTEINVNKTLEEMSRSVSDILEWKDQLIASETMPITALVPLTILCAKLMRTRENHRECTDKLLHQVGQLAPRALLDERTVLLKRIEALERENRELSGQEEARILQQKLHKKDMASFKWQILMIKMLRAEERRHHHGVTSKLRNRNIELQERLSKFADGQRLRTKAGGARVLSYDALQLLSPRTATPVVSDDEGDHCPLPSSAVRKRLAQAENAGGGKQSSMHDCLTEPGLLGDCAVNRTGTARDMATAMTRSVTKSLHSVSFDKVVRAHDVPAYSYARSMSGKVSQPERLTYRPASMGGTLPRDDDQSLASINQQWISLFDGNGTDPGCEGAKPANVLSADNQSCGTRMSEDDGTMFVMPFVNERISGSRASSRTMRYRHSHREVAAQDDLMQNQLHGNMLTGSQEDNSARDDRQDIARHNRQDNCKERIEGPGPEITDAVQTIEDHLGNLLDEVPVLNLDRADSDMPASKDAQAGIASNGKEACVNADMDMSHESQFDGDMLPRTKLLEVKLKHSLQIRAMQRSFEERLQITNQYWRDQGRHMVDCKNGSPSRVQLRQHKVTKTWKKSDLIPGTEGMSTSLYKGAMPSVSLPGTPSSQQGSSLRKFEIDWSRKAKYDRNGTCETDSCFTPISSQTSISRWEDFSAQAAHRPATSEVICSSSPNASGIDRSAASEITYTLIPVAPTTESRSASSKSIYSRTGCSSPWKSFSHSGVVAPINDGSHDVVEPRYHAFIYPGRRLLSSYAENRAELSKHSIKTHVSQHSVKPFAGRGKLGRKISDA